MLRREMNQSWIIHGKRGARKTLARQPSGVVESGTCFDIRGAVSWCCCCCKHCLVSARHEENCSNRSYRFASGSPGGKIIISSQIRQSKPASSTGCTAEVQAEPFAPRSSATNRLALVLGHNQKLTAPPSRSPPACEASVPGDSWKNIKERYQQRSPLTLKAVVGVSRDQSWPMNPRCLALDPEDPEDHPRLARSCLTQGAHVTDDRRRALTPQASFWHFKTLQGQLK